MCVWLCVCECKEEGQKWPHKTGRKENRGRKGCTVCAEQECLLKTKPIKASGIKTRSVQRGDVNSCSPGSSFKREPIGQWQLQGLKWELAGQRLSRPLRASNFHPLTLCTCYTCQHSCSLNKYLSANNLQIHVEFWVKIECLCSSCSDRPKEKCLTSGLKI